LPFYGVTILISIGRKVSFLNPVIVKVALKLSPVHLSGGGWALGAVGQN
jgi:hypothetical protein